MIFTKIQTFAEMHCIWSWDSTAKPQQPHTGKKKSAIYDFTQIIYCLFLVTKTTDCHPPPSKQVAVSKARGKFDCGMWNPSWRFLMHLSTFHCLHISYSHC